MQDCKCGSKEFYLEMRGNNVGVYCKHCNKWQTWLGKQKVAEFKNRGFKIYSQGANPFQTATTETTATTSEKTLAEVVIPCGGCGGVENTYAKKGSNFGCYCKRCLKWKRWIKKTDVKAILAKGIKIYTYESLQPTSTDVYSADMQEEYMNHAIDGDNFEKEEYLDNRHEQDQSAPNTKINYLPDSEEDELPSSFYEEQEESFEDSEQVEDEEGLTPFERKMQEQYEHEDNKIKALDCTVCTSGELDVIGGRELVSVMFNADSKAIIICNPSNTKVYGHIDTNFCPKCGRKL